MKNVEFRKFESFEELKSSKSENSERTEEQILKSHRDKILYQMKHKGTKF